MVFQGFSQDLSSIKLACCQVAFMLLETTRPLRLAAGCRVRSRSAFAPTAFLRRHVFLAMASAAPLELAVKGDPKTKTLGDCPFCHRVLLTAEEKKAPYTKEYVEFSNKPKWLLEVNPEGSVPVAKTPEGEWLTSSASIVDWLEKTYPEPPLGTAESAPEEGSQVFPAFVALVKASKEETPAKEAALVEQLGALDAHLSKHGPFLKGKNLSTGDLALAPKLHHLEVAGKALKGFSIPDKFGALREYLGLIEGRPSWKATHYADELVIDGWRAKLPSS